MIIVTGTKRSGTSMWMQILNAAGAQIIGEAFPRNWKETIEAANPHGFYESQLRSGVYYATNPNPKNGQYLAPHRTTKAAVKVFIPGLCRTDMAFIHRVVGTMRHWREYAASLERLHEMENAALDEKRGKPREHGELVYLDPVLEWWLENFALIRDLVTRQYAAHVVTYENVLEDAENVLPPIIEWLGLENADDAIAAVSPETRTQDRQRIDRSHPHEDMFDELYDTIASGDTITGDFLQRINETHRELIPEIEEGLARVMDDRRKRARPRRRKNMLHPDILEAVIHRSPDGDESDDGDYEEEE